MSFSRKTAVLTAICAAALASLAFAAEPVYSKDGLGLSGYDAVAYFTEGKPVRGRAEFEQEWGGVKWRFASAANRDAFAKSPEKYAPQYGGWCAYAVSRNYTAPTDPEAWKIVDGRLYLNYDKAVRGLWEKELPDAIRKADKNWPAVLSKPSQGN